MTEGLFSSTHPLLPPTSEDDRLDRLRLLRSRRVGISTYQRLMAEHGSASEALAALPQVAREAGLSDYQARSRSFAEAELRDGVRAGAQLVFQGDPDYPARLLDIEDSPPFIWMRGNPDLLECPSIALVGARNASSLGTRMARALAKDLARRGMVTVSGLARGIDTVVHHATLETGTIAVYAGGIDVIYPSENTSLGQEVANKGLVITEMAPGLTPLARHFPARNRLISGLSQAMVVVEAAAKSGSMNAARAALDQGREVLAVPGHPFEPRAAGCNMLIRDGAKLVRSAEDIIEAMSPIGPRTASVAQPPPVPQAAAPQPERRLRDTARLHDEILACLDPAPMPEDRLIRSLGHPTQIISEQLSDLELEGRIERQSGGVVRRLS
ncbi:MAG: DNA-processing protein DprA [Marinovum sp.]|nr:DNA-processing protein DprA [Marinovum sp.]